MNEERFLTAEDVAQRLGVSVITVHRQAKDGGLPPPIESNVRPTRWREAEIVAEFGDKPLLSLKQVAERLGITEGALRQRTNTGKFPEPHRVGKAMRWPEPVIDEYLGEGSEPEPPVPEAQSPAPEAPSSPEPEPARSANAASDMQNLCEIDDPVPGQWRLNVVCDRDGDGYWRAILKEGVGCKTREEAAAMGAALLARLAGGQPAQVSAPTEPAPPPAGVSDQPDLPPETAPPQEEQTPAPTAAAALAEKWGAALTTRGEKEPPPTGMTDQPDLPSEAGEDWLAAGRDASPDEPPPATANGNGRHEAQWVGKPGAIDEEERGTVKWFDPTKGFGFIVPHAAGADVFVHAALLERLGITDLFEGEAVSFLAVQEARGRKAVSLTKLPPPPDSAVSP